jgi:pyruvate/2-oxoglutarate/acetoin dehydrogenase E1 component
MNNSSNKWPENYKLFTSAVKPNAPVLTLDSNTSTTATLSWTYKSNECLPISNFNVYQNGVIISILPYTTTTITLNLTTGSYSFYVTSISTTVESSASNTVSVTI